jgi:hypothetical protein
LESNWRNNCSLLGYGDWEFVPFNPTRKAIKIARLNVPIVVGSLILRWVIQLKQESPVAPIIGVYGGGLLTDYVEYIYGLAGIGPGFPYRLAVEVDTPP